MLGLLLGVCGVGCSGINASVPVSPMMFMQNSLPQTTPAVQPGPTLAVNDTPLVGQ